MTYQGNLGGRITGLLIYENINLKSPSFLRKIATTWQIIKRQIVAIPFIIYGKENDITKGRVSTLPYL